MNSGVIPLILLGIGLSVAGQTALKKGMDGVGVVDKVWSRQFLSLPLAAGRQPWILLGIPMYVAAAVVWISVLSQADLSFAFPFLGLNYVLVALSARLFLGEHVNYLRWVGVGIILLGVVLMGVFG